MRGALILTSGLALAGLVACAGGDDEAMARSCEEMMEDPAMMQGMMSWLMADSQGEERRGTGRRLRGSPVRVGLLKKAGLPGSA